MDWNKNTIWEYISIREPRIWNSDNFSNIINSLNSHWEFNVVWDKTISFRATWVFVATIAVEWTVDWYNYTQLYVFNTATAQAIWSITVVGNYLVNTDWFKKIRFRCTAYTSGECKLSITWYKNKWVDLRRSTQILTCVAWNNWPTGNSNLTITLPWVPWLRHYIYMIQAEQIQNWFTSWWTNSSDIRSTNLTSNLFWVINGTVWLTSTWFQTRHCWMNRKNSFSLPIVSTVAWTDTTITRPNASWYDAWIWNSWYTNAIVFYALWI